VLDVALGVTAETAETAETVFDHLLPRAHLSYQRTYAF
jgi:hypothetical protein